jgi:hypothetical protein
MVAINLCRSKIFAKSDYLNWFEATQLSTRSGRFEGFLNTSSAASPSAAHRKDAFSAYLDAMEEQF